MPYTINDFTKEYCNIKESVASYRIGQHFINKFIKDSSSYEMQKLWNEFGWEKAMVQIHKIVQDNQWDYNDLPLLRSSTTPKTFSIGYGKEK